MKKIFGNWQISDHPPWLRQDGKSRLFSLTLKNVSDPLNADPIWDATTGGDSGITDGNGEYSGRRLLQALKAHYYTTTAYRNKVPVIQKFIFSDVVVWIPATLWREAEIENGESLFLMIERFRYQHEMSFSEDQRFQKRPPNFCIMPMQGLAMDEVICQFGLGVFLPNKEDVQTASLTIAKQSHSPTVLPDWVFFERENIEDSFQQVSKVTRPSGLYADQTMLLLAHNHQQSAVQSPYWINGHSDGEVIINLNSSKPSAYGDEHNISSLPPKRNGRQTDCYFYDPRDTKNGITLIIERVAKNKVAEALRATSHSKSTGTVIDDGEDSFSGLTNIDIGGDDLPDYIYQLALKGIVLPRIDNLRDSDKILHWELSLDQLSLPVSHDEAPHWQIRAGSNAQTIEWKLYDDSGDWELLDHNSPLPYPEKQAIHLLPPALSEKQFAILPLSASATNIPVTSDTLVVGRSTGANSLADFPLDALRHCSSIVYKDGSKRGALDMIGLSAEHIAVKLHGRKVELQQLKSLSYVLNKNGEIRQVLSKKNSRGELKPGEKLIVGPLYFELIEEFLPDRID